MPTSSITVTNSIFRILVATLSSKQCDEQRIWYSASCVQALRSNDLDVHSIFHCRLHIPFHSMHSIPFHAFHHCIPVTSSFLLLALMMVYACIARY